MSIISFLKNDFKKRQEKSRQLRAKWSGADLPADGTIIGNSKTEKTVTGVIGTIFSIVIFVPLGIGLIVIGVILSLSIIGAFIGIPLIIVGIGMAIAGPFGGLTAFGMKKAKCPYCGNVLRLNFNNKSIKCRVCKKLSLIKNGKLELVA